MTKQKWGLKSSFSSPIPCFFLMWWTVISLSLFILSDSPNNFNYMIIQMWMSLAYLLSDFITTISLTHISKYEQGDSTARWVLSSNLSISSCWESLHSGFWMLLLNPSSFFFFFFLRKLIFKFLVSPMWFYICPFFACTGSTFIHRTISLVPLISLSF